MELEIKPVIRIKAEHAQRQRYVKEFFWKYTES